MIFLMTVLMVSLYYMANAQSISKNNVNYHNDNVSNSSANIKTFDNNIAVLQTAFMSQNHGQVQQARSALIRLASAEIRQTRKNLNALKSGMLTHDAKGKKFNLRLENYVLSNSLNREIYLYNHLKKFDPDSTYGIRELGGIKGNLLEFEKLMISNQKYEKVATHSSESIGHTHASSISSLNNSSNNANKGMIISQAAKRYKPTQNNIRPPYLNHMENKEISKYNYQKSNRKVTINSIVKEFDKMASNNQLDKAVSALGNAERAMRSDIAAKQQLVEKAKNGKFKYTKINIATLKSKVISEQHIFNRLIQIRVKSLSDLNAHKKHIIKLINDFSRVI